MIHWKADGVEIHHGHVLDVLGDLHKEGLQVQCIVTSPPYWSKRNYQTDPIDWLPVSYRPMPCMAEISVPRWRGSLGLEPRPETYVGHLVAVWRALWRVLRDDGVCWLVIGDTRMGSGQGWMKKESRSSWLRRWQGEFGHGRPPSARYDRERGGIKPKDLVGIPWRVAFALQADGWYLRSDIVWAKGLSFCKAYSGAAIPESVRGRPTTGHETVFLLSKKRRYFYDKEAVTEVKTAARGRNDNMTDGRNLRSVWAINTVSFAGAHFAVFPPALVEPCVKAGTSWRGCCSSCGSPWKRVMAGGREVLSCGGDVVWCPTCGCYGERQMEVKCPACHGSGRERLYPKTVKLKEGSHYAYGGGRGVSIMGLSGGKYAELIRDGGDGRIESGEACPKCGGEGKLIVDVGGMDWAVEPSVVLDPFSGSGTTGVVALGLGRRYIGVDANAEYCDMAADRLSKPVQTRLME